MIYPNECVCDSPGFCRLLKRKTDPSQGRKMTETRWNECKNKEGYFEVFLSESEEVGNVPLKIPLGVGTILKNYLLDKFGIEAEEGCECTSRAAEMNKNGPEWCETNIEDIANWLVEESKERPWIKHFVNLFPGTAREEAKRIVEDCIAIHRNMKKDIDAVL